MLKLSAITFTSTPRLPGLRQGDLTTINCANPHDHLLGWRAVVRGSILFFISPRGWQPGRSPRDRDPLGPRVIHEVPRALCFLHWEGADTDIEAIFNSKAKFDSPPFGPPAEEPAEEPAPPAPTGRSLLAQLDQGDE